MLQFNSVICTANTKFASRLWCRLSIPLSTNTAPISAESIVRVNKTMENTSDTKRLNSEECMNFNEFKEKLCSSLGTKSSFINNIQDANSIQDLLEITNTTSLLSQKDIIQVKEAINTWMMQNEKKKNLSNTESYSTSITEKIKSNIDNIKCNEDFNSIYGDLSTSGMIQQIHKLAMEGNRNVQLLKYFFENILKYNTTLCIGECSNLLFNMSKLCYSDERLINKICNDLLATRSTQTLPITTILSILKSMATVRYKNNAFLDKVCVDIEKNGILCTEKHIISILQSLSILGYKSKHLKDIIEKYLPCMKMKIGYPEWLNFVWSLIIQNAANADHIKSVLNETHIKWVLSLGEKRNMSYVLKLLNINGYAKYIMKDYSGPFLGDYIKPITKKNTKQKELYINALETTLKNLTPFPTHFKMNVNTKLGFLIDAELYMDNNFRSVPMDKIESHHIKIGIMVLDYHDLCINSMEPLGLNKLQLRLLAANKYKVISIPYHYFGIEDKIEKRVTYLKRQLWKCVK